MMMNSNTIFRYPLDENKDINDQTLLIRVIEQRLQDINKEKERLEKSIQRLKDYEISFYEVGPDESK